MSYFLYNFQDENRLDAMNDVDYEIEIDRRR